ncbi:ABC transporter permease [Aquimarina spongiae]|uniref:Putative ABC transport system permease protein n=1 Tax=Aquimarina spongiae TaxID=570521 RepID=A0A1M6EZQ0_9FLAO|nr:ABC transporter permease [Aquimarina spongiae]SHI90859.1 putative ABC transport system permease protein [Aquimarina spongiae]
MFKMYFKIAWRNLIKNKVYSGINIIGLAIGLTAGFLILQYVNFEHSYDKFHSKKNSIYRVVADLDTPSSGKMESSRPACAVPPHMEEEFPEVISAVRFMRLELAVRKDEIKLVEDKAAAADRAFFEMFDFGLLQGDKKSVLQEPYSVVLTQETANRYFGNESAIGKTIRIKDEDINDLPFTVTGIMDEIPENSHIKANMIISMTTYSKGVLPRINDAWGLYDPAAYILVHPNTDPKQLEAKFPDFLERNSGETMRRDKMFVSLFLEPLEDVYLRSERGGEYSGDLGTIYIFSIIAIFILLIACINFVNLTTARSVERAKEVGVRKVIGAEKRQLSLQFVGESIIISLIAFVIASILAALVLPAFNEIAGKVISDGIFTNPINIAYLFLIALSIGAFAGIYPAFVLSSFKPVNVLKGNFSTGTRGIILRKGLVITQFTISITLIIGTIIIYNQMNYMRSQELGFDKEHTVLLPVTVSSAQKELKDNIDNISGVVSTTLASAVPGAYNNSAYSVIQNSQGEGQIANINAYFVDHDFISQFGLKVIAGRGFSRDFVTDSAQGMIINEKAVKFLGYASPKDALGATFSQWGKDGQIIGVIQDFHFKSLQENIQPLTMTMKPDETDLLAIKITGNNIKQTLADIQNKWEAILPNDSFNYQFLDENFDKQYRSQERFGSLFLNFAVLAILISCLGLLGLAAYSMLQRKREIGVRKVLGASVAQVVKLLSTDFLKLVTVAFLIASPLAWYVMNDWLSRFAYRISIEWWMFLLAGTSAIIIALATVSFHALKASLANPVKSLRTE